MNTLEKFAVIVGITLSTLVLVVGVYIILDTVFQSNTTASAQIPAGKELKTSPPIPKTVIDQPKPPGPTPRTPPMHRTPPNTTPPARELPAIDRQPPPNQPPNQQPVQPPLPERKGNSVIKGKIVKDNNPVQDVLVEIYSFERTANTVNAALQSSTYSKNDGTFELLQLAPIEGYSIVARKKGVGMAVKEAIDLKNESVKDLGDIILGNSSVKGTVKDDKENPIPDCDIIVEKQVKETASVARKIFIEKATTDISGNYTIGPLSEGTYYLRPDKQGYSTTNVFVRIGTSTQEHNKNFIIRPIKK